MGRRGNFVSLPTCSVFLKDVASIARGFRLLILQPSNTNLSPQFSMGLLGLGLG